MKTLTPDARGFVEGVVTYLRREGKTASALPKVTSFLRKVTSRAKQENEATVESAVVLNRLEKQQLSHVLSAIVGHPMTFRYVINRQVLGGLRVTVVDWVVDTSLAGQLTNLADSLID